MKWRFWKKEKQYYSGWITHINFSEKNHSFTVKYPDHTTAHYVSGKPIKSYSINGKKVK